MITAPPSTCTWRNGCFLPYVSHHVDSCPSCIQTEAVLPHRGKRRCNVWKFQFVCTTPTLPYLILLQWTFKLFNSSPSVRILCKCKWTEQYLAMLGPAGGHTRLQSFASVVGSVRACTGMEGAASSKFGHANVNDRLKRLKDTILIHLLLTLFLLMHSMHCPTPCKCITYSFSCVLFTVD